MKPINNAMDDLFQLRELAEDEYLNEANGLIYCSKGNRQILFRRMYRKCPVGQGYSGSDDQLFQNPEYADRNVFR